MAEFLSDPSLLTKDKLKSELVANNVALPNGEQRKGVYVELYLKNLTSQNKKSSASVELFSSDEETAAPTASITARSGRKATKKTDRIRPEETDVTELTDEELKDQLLKYGVNAGPVVASTRKVYEKKLRTLLEQGPPQTTIVDSEPVLTHSSNRNGSTDLDQYSDKEEETTAPVPEPEPVPVVERPLRSRGKTPVTTKTRSRQQNCKKKQFGGVCVCKEEDVESDEEDFQVANVVRRSSHRLDHAVPDPFYKRARHPEKTVEMEPLGQQDRKLSKHAAALAKARRDDAQLSILNTALLEQVGTHEDLKSRPGHVELKSASSLKRTIQPDPPQLSKDLIHTTPSFSPFRALEGKGSLARTDYSHQSACGLHVTKRLSGVKDRSGAQVQSRIDGFFSPVNPVCGQDNSIRHQTPEVMIEKLSAAEQTPKSRERDSLKEMFPNEDLHTPTAVSITCRPPIKGAAGRPFSDTWLHSLRPRLTEHRYAPSSYTETRSIPHAGVIPRLSAVPLSVPKPTPTLSVQAKARRRVPVWVQLLLLTAVAGFLLFIYQAMESNQFSPFEFLSRDARLETSGK